MPAPGLGQLRGHVGGLRLRPAPARSFFPCRAPPAFNLPAVNMLSEAVISVKCYYNGLLSYLHERERERERERQTEQTETETEREFKRARVRERDRIGGR